MNNAFFSKAGTIFTCTYFSFPLKFLDVVCMLLLLEPNVAASLLILYHSADHCCGKEKAKLITIPQSKTFFAMVTFCYVFFNKL